MVGTSAGAIVGSLIAAGASSDRLRRIVTGIDYPRLLDKGALDWVPVLGPSLSLVLENGYAEGRRFVEWLTAELAALG